ncbi:MAG: TraM recognition domain-containing protein [Lewinellaceae bacterium]|nr:TraM recognition domain-containing protein [Saprospiraceae bacterium]MCB9338458.1 TraM recognition domain-containing protein [Lewinellaceae bacterium]
MTAVCVKQDERIRIEKTIMEADRGDDLVIISPETPFKVNALEYELFRKGRGGEVEYNQALDLLMEIFVLGENYQAGGASGGENDRFWDKELRICLTRLMMLLVLAGVPVTVPNMRKILVDAFGETEVERYAALWAEIEKGDGAAIGEYESWCNGNFFLYCFERANAREDMTPSELDVMQLVGDYYFKTFYKISEKTKAIITASAMGLFEPFMTGILKTHFSSEMSDEVRPEKCYEEGRLIIVDIPLKEYGISAVYAAGIMKKLFQLCMERRVVQNEENPRPCVLWIDEYHLLANPISDEKFQSSCRSTMTAGVYITQSINSIKVAMGRNNAEAKTKVLLTNLGTQIFCGNICNDTNKYAADLIGKAFIKTKSASVNTDDKASHSTSEHLHYIVPPEHFTTLKSGGPDNNFKVEAIMVVRGKKWATGETFREIVFDQRGRGKPFFQRLKHFFQTVKSFFQ